MVTSRESRTRLKAKEKALFHGGRMSHIIPGEGMATIAYLVGKREGWWNYGRGINTPELLQEYVNRHWEDFLEEPKENSDG